jgi:hypothetical protein
MVACAAQLVAWGLVALVPVPPGRPRLMLGLLDDGAVPLAWTLLALAGRWRPEPGWIEWLGRLLGVGWFALNVSASLLVHFVL